MYPFKNAAFSLVMLASLAFAPTTRATPPPDPVTSDQQVNAQDNCTSDNVGMVITAREYTLQNELQFVHQVAADSGFNPRTDFPIKKGLNYNAGFGTLSLQECCGGGGWGQDTFIEIPYLYSTLSLALIGALLWALTAHGKRTLRWLFRSRKTEAFLVG